MGDTADQDRAWSSDRRIFCMVEHRSAAQSSAALVRAKKRLRFGTPRPSSTPSWLSISISRRVQNRPTERPGGGGAVEFAPRNGHKLNPRPVERWSRSSHENHGPRRHFCYQRLGCSSVCYQLLRRSKQQVTKVLRRSEEAKGKDSCACGWRDSL